MPLNTQSHVLREVSKHVGPGAAVMDYASTTVVWDSSLAKIKLQEWLSRLSGEQHESQMAFSGELCSSREEQLPACMTAI